MSNNLKPTIALVFGSSVLFSSYSYALAVQNPCEGKQAKHDIHCAYIAPSASKVNKFIRLKEVQPGQPPVSMTFCAPIDRPIMSIQQNQWGPYQPGNNVTWQISQCQDEDCNINKSIMEDKFVITKSGKFYSSMPKTKMEVTLDPSYGVNCEIKDEGIKKLEILKKHMLVVDSSLQMRIDDAVSMLEAVPQAMANVTDILNQMRVIAVDAANNPHSSSELGNIDKVYQTLKDEVSKVQRFNTLDGYKVLSGGTLAIQIGACYYNIEQCILTIPLPATDIYSLGIAYSDVLDVTNAESSVSSLDYALGIMGNAEAID